MQWLNGQLAGCWDDLDADDTKLIVNNWVYIYFLEKRREARERQGR